MICAAEELGALVDLLVAGGLYGRKRLEMDAWAAAVEELRAAKRRGTKADKEVVRRAAEQLADIRQYRPRPDHHLLCLPLRDLRAGSLDALKRWSEEHDGALSCLAYNRWRPAGLPTRNTIARHYGGWHAALVAAGLEGRGAMTPETVNARIRPGSRRRQGRREAQRRRVLEAVARFQQEHGRLPRAMEFFRWRFTNAPDTPTQGSVYRLFPGGWADVLAAA